MEPHDPFAPPHWLPVLDRWVQRLGFARSLLLLTAVGWVAALLCAVLAIRIVGQGSYLIAAGTASACSIGLSLLFGTLLLSLVRYQHGTQAQLARRLHQDALTGVYNKRYFHDLAERELARAQRYEMSCALLLMDIDHFKRINDRFGPLCGDHLLCEIAAVSQETLRQGDVLAREGGEEFAILLPHTDPLGALDVAERLRQGVAELGFRWLDKPVAVSVSIGVASLRSEHQSLEQFVADAEAALRSAKNDGRNCVRAGDGGLGGRKTPADC